MKNWIVVFVIAIFIISIISACVSTTDRPSDSSDEVVCDEIQRSQLSVQQTIDAANTAEELRALIETYQVTGDSTGIYLAAKKLLELNPSDLQACEDAVTALIMSITADCDEIEALLWQYVQANPDSFDELIRWAYEQNHAFSYDVPFVPDYESVSEINTEGSTPGNLMNRTLYEEEVLPGEDLWQGGMLTYQGNWIYFTQLNEGYAIYKMRTDGSNLQRIGNIRGGDLNVVGDWLYFGNIDDRGRPYKIRTDGSLLSGPLGDECGLFSVAGDWIYYGNYSQNGVLYKSKTDGSETIPMIDSTGEIASTYDGWVYYSGYGGFFRIPVNGGDPQVLVGEWKADYCISDGWFYYIENSNLKSVHRIRLDGSDQSVVVRSDEEYQALNIAAGKLIVSVGSMRDEYGRPYPDKLLVLDLETGETLREIEAHASTIYAMGDWIFYPMLDQNQKWQSLNLVTGETVNMATVSQTQEIADETSSEVNTDVAVSSSSGNLFMGFNDSGAGFFSVQDEWIYFSDPSNEYLCKAKFQNGSDKQVLCEDSAAYINPVGDTVYYCNMWDDFSICSIGTDGQNQEKLANGHCEDLSYLDGWLYYNRNDGIYRLSAEGGKPELLIPGLFRRVYACDGWVYYIDENSDDLCRIPVDGGESEALLVDDPILTYAILDGGIYSLINAGDSYEIILTKADGSSRITIYSQPEPIDAFNVSENHLYLLASFENDALNVLTIWNMETNTIEQTMDDLIQPVVWCFDSDIVYLISDVLVRFNPNSGERVVFDN